MNYDISGLIKMFILVLGGSFAIIQLKNDKSPLGIILKVSYFIAILMVFIVTGCHFYFKNGGTL